MSLSVKQKQGAKLLAEGYRKAEVSRMCKVNPKTIYAWLEKEEFQKEIDKHKQKAEKELIDQTRDKMELLFENLLELAIKSKTDSVRYNATTYLIDRQLGKPVAKTENVEVATNKNDDKDIDDLLKDLEELDNVIDLKEVASAKKD